jgi:adenylate cyclase
MPLDEIKRKLAAIFSADVKGYSRLMGDDEMATVQTLKVYREVLGHLIRQHHGRVVDSPGDNLLAEFPSVVEAVQCAVESQQALADKNAALPRHRRMEFRIGINLGDVIEDGERIYGDGVNIAARMEALADGGGICISGTAYDQVENKLALAYDYLGEQAVKNIARPVRVYRVRSSEAAAVQAEVHTPPAIKGRHRLPLVIGAAGVILLSLAVVTLWRFYFRPRAGFDIASVKQKAIEQMAKPSIAVLPFTDLSADSEQGYFSDGVTNDIITDLSKFRDLFVIASNTVFTYKGGPVNVKEVGRELGVRYVLEGSIQRLGEKVRINAQLVDATTGHHLWAERYERDQKDLFAMQDEMVQTIVATLELKISAAERKRAIRKDTISLKAYDYVLRGLEHVRLRTRVDNSKAQTMFQRAIKLDPLYATAYVGLGDAYHQAFLFGWTPFPQQALNRAFDLAQKALSLDGANAYAHRLLGSAYLSRGQHDLAITELQRAIELNPNDARSYGTLGRIMLLAGRKNDAIELLETTLRFDPNSLEQPNNFTHLGLAYYLTGQHNEAIQILEKGLAFAPDFVGLYIALAATYAQVGRPEDARRAADTVLRLHPFFEVDAYGSAFRNPNDRTRIVDGLRQAGLK